MLSFWKSSQPIAREVVLMLDYEAHKQTEGVQCRSAAL